MENSSEVGKLLDSVGLEMLSAELRHGPYNSAHEAYAVLLEELDELWDEVKLKRSLRSKERMKAEAIQVAACAVRFIVDICKEGDGESERRSGKHETPGASLP